MLLALHQRLRVSLGEELAAAPRATAAALIETVLLITSVAGKSPGAEILMLPPSIATTTFELPRHDIRGGTFLAVPHSGLG